MNIGLNFQIRQSGFIEFKTKIDDKTRAKNFKTCFMSVCTMCITFFFSHSLGTKYWTWLRNVWKKKNTRRITNADAIHACQHVFFSFFYTIYLFKHVSKVKKKKFIQYAEPVRITTTKLDKQIQFHSSLVDVFLLVFFCLLFNEVEQCIIQRKKKNKIKIETKMMLHAFYVPLLFFILHCMFTRAHKYTHASSCYRRCCCFVLKKE